MNDLMNVHSARQITYENHTDFHAEHSCWCEQAHGNNILKLFFVVKIFVHLVSLVH